MSQPLSEYFAQEAGEFLDRLDALLARPDAPDAVELFRLARGVRGSAQIAGAEGVASVAERLEDGARSYRDGLLPWSDALRERVRLTAADLRALVSVSGRWGPAEETRAREAAARWEGTAAGRRRGDAAPPAGDALLAFFRRELEGVVAEMDRALGELAAAPDAREPLRAVLRRMRPVRGVAGMESVAGVLELLEGIEDAAHDVLSRAAPVEARQLDLLRAGRDALDAARAALERGEGVGESPELERFRALRDGAEGEEAAEEPGVVPVSTLFFDDAGPHVVSSPLAPTAAPEAGGESAGGALAEVESFLRIEATGFLDRAEGLISGLTTRPARRFGRLARDLSELAAGVRDLAVTYGMTAIAVAAEDAASRLGGAGSAEEARTVLRRLRASLPGAEPLPEPAVEVEPDAPAPLPSAPVTQAPEMSPSAAAAPAADAEGVVPIESLFYDTRGALRDALALKPRIQALAGSAGGTPLAEALDELFGLVELGLDLQRAP